MTRTRLQQCLCELKQQIAEGGGGSGLNYRGEWETLGDGIDYVVGDLVTYDVPDDGFGANVYICITDHTSQIAVTPDVEAGWALMAGGGADGDAGPSGDSSYHGFIEAPTNKTYVLVLTSDVNTTIIEMAAQTASGTLDAEIRINGTPVSGLDPMNVSSGLSVSGAIADNVINQGDKIELVITNASSPVDFAFSLIS